MGICLSLPTLCVQTDPNLWVFLYSTKCRDLLNGRGLQGILWSSHGETCLVKADKISEPSVGNQLVLYIDKIRASSIPTSCASVPASCWSIYSISYHIYHISCNVFIYICLSRIYIQYVTLCSTKSLLCPPSLEPCYGLHRKPSSLTPTIFC